MPDPGTPPVLALGRLACAAQPFPRHHLLHLPDRDVVVVPTCRAGTGWHCQVVASPAERPTALTVADHELARAATIVTADPRDDPDRWALLVWPAAVFTRFPGGAVHSLADLLSRRLRTRGGLHVPDRQLRRDTWIAGMLPNCRPVAVPVLLDRLATTGHLAPAVGGLRLTLPAGHPTPSDRPP